MHRDIPEESLKRATEEHRKIYYALDNLIDIDIIICKDNNVLLRFKLGDKTVAEYPVHCDVIDNEVIISEYANSKSDKQGEKRH